MDNLVYVPHFDVAAAAVVTALLIMHQFRRSYPTRSGRVYRIMLYLLLAASVSDFLSSFTITYPQSIPLWLNYLINCTYLLTLNLIAVFYYAYIHYATSDEKISLLIRLFIGLCGLSEILLVLSTPITHLVIYFNEAGEYCHGPAFIILYGITSFLILLSLIHTVRFHSILNQAQVSIFVAFTLVMAISVVFQYFFPRYLLTVFVASILMMIINVMLENPSDYMYKNTYCYNETAMYDAVGRYLSRGASFTVVLVGAENATLFNRLFDQTSWGQFIEHLIETMHGLFGTADVFYLHNGYFAVITTHDPKVVIEPASQRLRETLSFDETELSLIPYFCVFNLPSIVKNGKVLRDMIEYSIQQHEQKGGDSVTTITGEDIARHEREQRVLHSIREAIRLKGFQVYYQPIMNAETGRYVAAEALVRLRDPELGMIPPDEFIVAAERNGLILQIGEMVLEEVCRFWQDSQLQRFNISFVDVNLSAMQCMQLDLESRVMNILRRYKLEPRYINLEITETAAATNEAMMRENMDRLAKRGIAFSIDDFGTGYSNADYLSSLPIRIVKIDKSLLWKAMDDNRSMVVLRNTCNMIRQLGLHCVAEGVESQAMVSVLQSAGVNYYQGFLFARPMPGEEFIEFLRRR